MPTLLQVADVLFFAVAGDVAPFAVVSLDLLPRVLHHTGALRPHTVAIVAAVAVRWVGLQQRRRGWKKLAAALTYAMAVPLHHGDVQAASQHLYALQKNGPSQVPFSRLR